MGVDTPSLEAGATDPAGRAIRDLKLIEVATERHGSRIDLVVLLRDAHHRVDRPVRDVTSILLERDTDGNASGLRVDTAAGQTTLLRFRVPARPETLDGLAPRERP